MTTALAPITAKAQEYVAAAKADATVRAYRSDWAHFTAWCEARQFPSLPAAPATVALYLADHGATLKPSTLTRHMAAISKAHQHAGYESPAAMRHAPVSEVLAGIRRKHGTAQTQKAPVLIGDVRRMVAVAGANVLLSLRNRALLLIGFAGAFRRSELVALDVADVQEVPEGLRITLRRSKTDQEGAGRKIGIPYGSTVETCPVRAYRAWIESAGITEGAAFRSVNRHGNLGGRLSDKAVAIIVKNHALTAGLDPAQYSGHSLRSGLATSAAIAGVSERAIMAQTGHKSAAMVRRYIRDGSLFRENAAAGVGL